MSRYRLVVSPSQERVLRAHCAHARYVWNLAVEQHSCWRPGRRSAPGFLAQAGQLTEARAAFRWLRDGSQVVQQQALRDFAQAMANFFAGTHGKPTWRKAGRHEGFRIVAVEPAHVRRLCRRLRRGLGTQGRVGAVPLVPACPGGEVLPGHLRPGRTLAHRVRRHSRAHSRPGSWRRAGHRPGRDHQCCPVHQARCGLPGAASGRTGPAAKGRAGCARARRAPVGRQRGQVPRLPGG